MKKKKCNKCYASIVATTFIELDGIMCMPCLRRKIMEELPNK